jgi:NitT/TauT family transport system substrate-binding protein
MKNAVKALIIIVIALILLSSIYYTYTSISTSNNDIIVVGVEFNDHSAAFWIALDLGYFRSLGLNIQYKAFSTGLELAVALSRGDFDIALACIGPLIVMYSRGVQLILVSMTHLNGYSLVTRNNVSSIRDLNGLKVSVSGPGSPTWLLEHMVMDKYNIGFKTYRMPPYIAVNALLHGDIDASFLPEHYATLAVKLGGHRLLSSNKVWREMPGSGVVVRKEFLKEHKDVVYRFVYALYKAIEYIHKHPYKSALIVAKHLATSVDIAYDSMKYLNYTLSINISAIKTYANLLYEYGAIDHRVGIDEFIDLSILRDLGISYEG